MPTDFPEVNQLIGDNITEGDFKVAISKFLEASRERIGGGGNLDEIDAFIKQIKPVATSGSYNDLTDKPTIPTIPPEIVTRSENLESVSYTGGIKVNSGTFPGSYNQVMSATFPYAFSEGYILITRVVTYKGWWQAPKISFFRGGGGHPYSEFDISLSLTGFTYPVFRSEGWEHLYFAIGK